MTRPLLGLVGAIVGWQIAVTVGNVPTLIVPSPVKVAQALARGLTQPPNLGSSFLFQAVPTLTASLLGFVVASVIGILLGVALFEWRSVRQTLWPLVIAFQALPKVAVAPLLVIWFGSGIEAKVVLVAIVAFFPIFINTMVGLEALDQDTEEMLRSFGASGLKILRYGRFPAALPVIFAGLQSGLLISLVAVVVGEFVGGSRGLGVLITQAQYTLDIPAVFAILIVFSVLGVGLMEIVSRVERRVVFWRLTSRGMAAEEK